MIQKPGRNENFYPVFYLDLKKYDMMKKEWNRYPEGERWNNNRWNI